ncbi:hypothetical protein N182_35060 [Sinorhizobium sp. GL2]|nr:hypothetical protein N182_35060 [Sinorhizobium sp. GL2]
MDKVAEARPLRPGKVRHSPARPRERPGDLDDVVARRRRILLAPGDTEPDLEIDAAHGPKLETSVRQILRPFRRKADAEAGGNQRYQREGIVAADAMLPVRPWVSNISEK